MARYGARLRELREKLAKLKHFRLLKEEICGAAGVYGYDPSKLVLFPDFMTGTRLARFCGQSIIWRRRCRAGGMCF